jgi:hypothetical protein
MNGHIRNSEAPQNFGSFPDCRRNVVQFEVKKNLIALIQKCPYSFGPRSREEL